MSDVGRAGVEAKRLAEQLSSASKALNDCLALLRRYLGKQVGRLCDAVWSEICRAPGNATLNAHLRRHAREYVAVCEHERRWWFTRTRRGAAAGGEAVIAEEACDGL